MYPVLYSVKHLKNRSKLVFCLFLKFGQTIVIRVLMLNF